MKKYFLSIVALAGMLFATSCQESLVEPQVAGPTTFTIEIPGQMGTKATGDQYALFVEVYSADGVTKIHRLEDAITVGTPKTVSLNLVATQVYDIIFWAQKEGASYDVSNLNKVEITDQHHNSENGAAFYAIKNDYKPVEVNNPSVTLKRPFAQLNIGTIDEVSYDNNGNKKLEILSTNIKVESAAKYFERINTQESPELGEGRTEVVFEYTGGDVLNSTMTVNTKTYKQVSMDYISVLGNKAVVVVTATIKVKDPNGVESTIERVITNVPLQMNYKTNIVGNLITSASDFTIEISEDWDGNDIDKEVVFREVATAAELQDAINEGVDNITLTENITVNSTLVFKAVPSQSNISRASADVAEFVLDLNGNNLSYAVQNNVGASAIINIHPNAKLSIVGNGTISFVSANPDTQAIPSYATNTITNEGYLVIGEGVVVINESEGGASYAVDDKGKFVLNGGTLIGKRCALRIAKYNQDNVYFEMNGGMVTAQKPAWIQLPGSDANSAPKIDVVINNGTFQSTNSTSAENDLLYTYSFGNSHANTTLTINGGNFIGGTVSIGAGYKGDSPAININGGAFDYDVVRWLEDDASEVIYSANPTAVYITDPAQLTNDVIENNETIYLAAGEYIINLYDITPKYTSLTIVGTEGTKVAHTASNYNTGQLRLELFDSFTIKNCEILKRKNVKDWGMMVFSKGRPNGVYTIENCTFNGVGTQGIYINEDIDGAIYNIKNCTFNGNFGNEGAITIQTNQGVNHIVNVTGCKFNNVPADHRIFLAPNKGLFYDFTLNTDLEATTADEFNMFVKLGLQNIRLADGVYNAEYFYLKGKNINISAVNPGNVTINSFVHLNGGKYNFNGITFMNPNQNTNPEAIGEEQKAFQYKSCVGVANMPTEVLFEDCKFVIENVDYAMWAHCYTTSIFENCYFECNHLRPIATNGPRTIVNNCVFNNQHHYALRLFENNHNSQYVEFTNNTITGTRSPGKVDSEGINISKKDGSANITGTFVIKGNTDGLKYRHHEKVTMDASCVYDTDIENFAFEREQ